MPRLASRPSQIAPKWKERTRHHTTVVSEVGSCDHAGPDDKMTFFSPFHPLLPSLKHSLLDFVHSLWHSIPPQPNIDSIASVLIKSLCFLDNFAHLLYSLPSHSVSSVFCFPRSGSGKQRLQTFLLALYHTSIVAAEPSEADHIITGFEPVGAHSYLFETRYSTRNPVSHHTTSSFLQHWKEVSSYALPVQLLFPALPEFILARTSDALRCCDTYTEA